MTTNFPQLVAALAFLAAGSASADAIYRCQKGGRLSYSDVPCAADATPAAASAPMPALVPMTPTTRGEQSLAAQFDEAAAHAAADQQRENAAFTQDYQAKKAREKAIRKGLDKGFVVIGMSRSQVERVLNEPAQVEPEDGGQRERWIYLEGKHKRTITFENGLVVSDSSSHSKKTKTG